MKKSIILALLLAACHAPAESWVRDSIPITTNETVVALDNRFASACILDGFYILPSSDFTATNTCSFVYPFNRTNEIFSLCTTNVAVFKSGLGFVAKQGDRFVFKHYPATFKGTLFLNFKTE